MPVILNGTSGINSPGGDISVSLTTGTLNATTINTTNSTLANLTVTNDASISGLTVGKGGGAVTTNTVVGAVAFGVNTTGYGNIAIGRSALASNTSGNNNTAVGPTNAIDVGSALGANTTGSQNIALGGGALNSNTTASNNTAVGYQAGYANTTGVGITAIGGNALQANTTGVSNVGVGGTSFGNTGAALQSNTTGSFNTALGVSALLSNTTASNNTAVGYQAGYSGTIGQSNTYLGIQAGYTNTQGNGNTFIGNSAGYSFTNAANANTNNTFIGNLAGYSITTGQKNTILGGYDGNQGGLDIRTLSNHIVLSDGDGNIRQFTNNSGFTKITDSGASAVLSAGGTYHEVVSNDVNNAGLITVCTNASYAGNGIQSDIARNTTNNSFYAFGYFNRGAGAFRFRVADSGDVTNTNNSYGSISDLKLKENIVDATPKLEDLCKVKVRQYNLKSDPDRKQIGVVAQELEEVFAGLVDVTKDTDKDGNDLGTTTKQVKYSVFVPMLIKAIQELNAKVEAQALEIATLKGN
jgi:hypothetical protein